MSRLSKALVTAAAAGLIVPVWAGPASAETVAETAAIGAYYLSSNPGVVGANPSNPLGGQKAPENAKNADQVAQDDLAVAVNVPSMPDKFSALQWPLLDLTPGATVESAKVTLPFSTKPESSRNDRNPALVVVCAAGPEGFGDADGEPFQDAPSQEACKDPATFVTGTPVEGGAAVEFDITTIAQTWTELNTGLLLYPSPEGLNKPHQNVFADKSQARLTLSFTALEEVVVDDAELFITPEVLAEPSTETSTSTVDPGTFSSSVPSTDTFSSSGGSTFATGSTDTGSTAFDTGSLDVPVAAGDVAEPSVAGEAPVVARGPIVRAAAEDTSALALDAGTWLALVGGAGLLAVVSLALGAPAALPGAARQTVRPGGVASALARRASSAPFGTSR